MGPCCVVLALFGGRPTLVCTAIGLLVAYFCDAVDSREGSLVSIWITLLVAFVTIVLAGWDIVVRSAWNVCLLVDIGLILLLVRASGRDGLGFDALELPFCRHTVGYLSLIHI